MDEMKRLAQIANVVVFIVEGYQLEKKA